MPVKCVVCSSPDLAAIDSLLDSGTPKKEIAEQFGVSPYSVSRHARHGASSAPADGEESLWLDRLHLAYERAKHDGDQRGMEKTAATGLRVARQRKAERIKAAAAAAPEPYDARVSIGSLDELVSVLTQADPDPIDRAKIMIALEKGRLLNRPDAETIFIKMYENREFAEALSNFAATWEPARKGEPDAVVQNQTSAPN